MLPTIATGNVGSALAGQYEVANSCRFDRGSSSKLSKSISSSGNRKTWTWSAWIKRGNLPGATADLFGTPYTSLAKGSLYFDTSERLYYSQYEGGGASNNVGIRTNRVFRDTSAWYHICLIWDTTDSTADDRIRLYINGTRETDLGVNTNPSLNIDGVINNSSHDLLVAGDSSYASLFFDGYMCEVVFIDSQALLPDNFGEFDADTGIWKPIDVSGLTFGTNGFYLDFEDSSALGNDVSGNNNDFTVNNLTSIDQNEDTCTNNWCTQNPLSYRSGQTVPTYSEGNLKVVYAAGVNTFSYGTLGVQAGKWYWEVKVTFGSNVYTGIGFASAATNTDINGYLLRQTGQIYNTSGSASSYASALSSGDTVMVAFDADNGTLWFGVNGTWSNSATQTEIENGTTTNSAFSGIDMSSIWLPLSKGGTSSNSNTQSNFGNEIYSISSGNADANGHGNFEYTVPSGYFALCTKNLAEHG